MGQTDYSGQESIEEMAENQSEETQEKEGKDED